MLFVKPFNTFMMFHEEHWRKSKKENKITEVDKYFEGVVPKYFEFRIMSQKKKQLQE